MDDNWITGVPTESGYYWVIDPDYKDEIDSLVEVDDEQNVYSFRYPNPINKECPIWPKGMGE